MTFALICIYLTTALSPYQCSSTLQMEDSQTILEMEPHPQKPPTSEPIKLPDDDAQNSEPLLHNVHIQQREDHQTTIELETHPPKPPTSEPIKLPDDDAQRSKPVGGVKIINNQIIMLRTQ